MGGKKIKSTCEHCEEMFEVLMIKVRQGKGKFCSTQCYANHRKNGKKDVKKANVIYQKKSKYGLDEESYVGLFAKQNNKCRICETSFDDVRACVDHSHTTGIVRGLLCDKCNRGLGYFNDNPDLLSKAIEYLAR